MRTILLHVNLMIPDDDPRTPDELAATLLDRVARPIGDASELQLAPCDIDVPLAEEVG